MSLSLKNFITWIFYSLIIIYGSLIPFDLRDMAFDDGVASFLQISFLDLGVVSRADWIANILLYIPLAYLGMSAFLSLSSNSLPRLTVAIFVFLSGVILMLGVEFLQTFFAPRTVSLNDLLAESIGLFIGIGIWLLASSKIREYMRQFSAPGNNALFTVLLGYSFLYLGLMAFPFDIIVSTSELRWKLENGLFSMTLIPCDQTLLCSLKLLIEMLLVVPIGIGFMLFFRIKGLFAAFLIGAVFSVIIEVGQFFLVSGVSQGLSIISRGLGFMLAAWLFTETAAWFMGHVHEKKKRLIIFTLPVYFFVVLYLNKLIAHPYVTLDLALVKFDELNMLPFYYHYFTTETEAVVSLLSYFCLYFIFGAGVGFWRIAAKIRYYLTDAYTFGIPCVILMSFFIETAKLFVEGEKPDPTNILISVIAVFAGIRIVYWLQGFKWWIAPSIRDGN